MSYLRDKLGKSCAWMQRQITHCLILIQISQKRIITSNWMLNMGNVRTSEANNRPFGERRENSAHCLEMVNMHQGVCASLTKASSRKLLFSGLCLVLIAVSNMAVRTQRKHLGTYTHAAPSKSQSRPTFQAPVSPFQTPSSWKLVHPIKPTITWILMCIDHSPRFC